MLDIEYATQTGQQQPVDTREEHPALMIMRQ